MHIGAVMTMISMDQKRMRCVLKKDEVCPGIPGQFSNPPPSENIKLSAWNYSSIFKFS